MFNYKIVDINMDINLVMDINRSLYDMKVLGNNYKRLKLINQDVNYYDGMLLEIKYMKESSILYLKWLINDDIKIVDTIFNPYLDIEDDSYIFYNRLKTDEYIILKKGGKYRLNVRFNLLKSIQIPKVIIDYFMMLVLLYSVVCRIIYRLIFMINHTMINTSLYYIIV